MAKHAFMDEYSDCYWCHKVSYRDVYGWFGDDEPREIDEDSCDGYGKSATTAGIVVDTRPL